MYTVSSKTKTVFCVGDSRGVVATFDDEAAARLLVGKLNFSAALKRTGRNPLQHVLSGASANAKS
jgi:hypothetical protein